MIYPFGLIRRVALTWRFTASFGQAGKLALMLTGSQRHHVNKSTSYFSGTTSICRGDLAKALMDKAARLPNVNVRFGCSLQSLDMPNRSIYSIPWGGAWSYQLHSLTLFYFGVSTKSGMIRRLIGLILLDLSSVWPHQTASPRLNMVMAAIALKLVMICFWLRMVLRAVYGQFWRGKSPTLQLDKER